uniref:Uncharacterized protein n=1 Tax=Magallana gigas TaxID=29159 RepID=A0A8W8KI97_MAGGI
MASLDGGPRKRRKTDDELLESFHDSFLCQNPSFADAIYRFKDITTGLGAFTIGSCNAADPDNGCSFNKAVCTIKPTQRVYAFANFFVDAFKMLKNFVTKKEIPSDMTQRMLDMTDNSMGSGLVQLAAKTIVQSFYYRQVYPERENSLIPGVGVSSTGLVFYFYDSVHDVLLGSSRFPLAAFSPFEINFTAVIALWMVLNHKYLCNGLSSVDIEKVPKAGFVTAARNKLHIYRAELRQGGVNFRLFTANSLDPLSFVNSKFILSDVLKDV